MSVKWKDGYDPQSISRRMEACKAFDSFGNLKFDGHKFDELRLLLYDSLSFPDYIPEIEALRIVRQAIFSVGRSREITAPRLIAAVARDVSAYEKLPPKKFVLISSFSAVTTRPLGRIRIRESIVDFPPRLPQRYRAARLSAISRAQSILRIEIPRNYLTVRTRMSARSITEAVYKAIDTIDIVRAIWNWHFNRPSLGRMTLLGPREPVNRILLGPLHTLHIESGELATETLYYEPGFNRSAALFNISRDQRLWEFYRAVRKCLAQCKYRDQMERALIRYVRALDESSWTTSLQKLWGLLEFLTHSTNGDNDVTIRRTIFVCDDPDYNRQVLNALRTRRNRYIHVDEASSEMEIYIYQLKRYVEWLIEFHLGNKFRFGSMEEAAKLLDCPFSDIDLKKRIGKAKHQISLAQKAREFHRYA